MPRPTVSFEFFPPKTIAAAFRLSETVQGLAPLAPEFVSVTYGAGGTTRKLTQEAVAAIRETSGLDVAGHLTCVGATREETLEIARGYKAAGLDRIVALRGDPPKGTGAFAPHPEGFADSVELVEALAATGDFTLHVGAYPELHPDAPHPSADVAWLKRKIDAGASSALTQFFFDPETFLRFRDACTRAQIDAPIVPGVLPVENWTGVAKFAKACGASIPTHIAEAFESAECEGRSDALAARLSTELCERLMAEGVDRFHFYTLNKPQLTREVCRNVGVVPARLQQVA